MVFSSITFLYYFLPIVLLAYYITPDRYKNITLLAGSYIFYAAGEPKYVVLLLISTLIDYFHARVIGRNPASGKAKVALISSVVMNLSMLLFFKYADFMIEIANGVTGGDIKALKLSLPIGISFFTFQTMSYTIDVYRGQAKAQKNPLDLAAYVALFPQLIAGPIVRYKTIAVEIETRDHSMDLFGSGVIRFILGLAKKVFIANSLGQLAILAKTASQPTILLYWLGAVAFALQIYYDFSGYSDMAIGLGRMFGFHFQENFNYPYISKSISEFWTRWHMSLGQWFRDYVYIPLGGNRKGLVKQVKNIAIVWLLTGLWHGASWNFVLWGAFLGFFIIIEKIVLNQWLNKLPKFIAHLYVLLVILVSFVMFNNESFAGMKVYFAGMFGGENIGFINSVSLYHLSSYGLILLVAILGSTPVPKTLMKKWTGMMTPGHSRVLASLFLVTIFLVITGYLVDDSFNPFLYFRF